MSRILSAVALDVITNAININNKYENSLKLRQTFIGIILFAAFPLNAQWLYSISDKNGSPMLQRINIQTYEVIDIVSLWPREYSDISFSSSGKLYGIDNETIDRIYEIDTLTGVSTLVFTFMDGSDIVGMTIDRNDVFYLTGETSNGVPELKTLNLSIGIPETITRLESGYNSINDCAFYEGNLYCCALGLPTEVDRGVLLKMDTSGMELHQEVFRYEKWPGHALASFNTKCKGDYLISSVFEQLNFFNFSDTSINSIPIFTSPWAFQSGGATSLSSWMGSIPPLQIDSIVIEEDPCLELSTITVIPGEGRTGIQYSLNASPFQGDSVFSDVITGFHTITLSDDEGCTLISDPFEIIKPDLETLFSATIKEATCSEDNGQITIECNLNPFSAEYSIDGTTWQTEPVFSNLAGGTYNVIIKMPLGCSDSILVLVPSISAIAASSTTSPEHCSLKDGFLEIEVNGGQPPYSYVLSNGMNSNLPVFDSLPSGNYLLTVSDSSGCTESLSISIANLSFIIESIKIENEICGNNDGAIEVTVVGDTGPYSYSLNEENQQNQANFAELPSGVYTIQVNDNNGCVVDSTFELLDINILPVLNVNAVNAKCNEDNGSILVSTESGNDLISLNSSPFQNIFTYEFLAEGAYTVIALNDYGCKDTINTVVVQEGSPEILKAIIQPEHCELTDGEIIVVEASSGKLPYNFIIDNNQQSSIGIFEGLNSGSHEIIIIDSNGCLNTALFSVEETLNPKFLSINVVPADCGNSDGQITIKAIGEGQLEFNLGNNTNFEGGFSGLQNGDYKITIRDLFGCSLDSIVTIPSNCEITFPNIFSPNGDNINDLFAPYGLAPHLFWSLEIFDRAGDMVFKSNTPSLAWDGDFNGIECQSGVYTWKLLYKEESNEEITVLRGDITLIR